MVYSNRDLDRKDVTEALAAMESHSELLKDYQRLRAKHVSAMTGITDARPWDMTLPAPHL